MSDLNKTDLNKADLRFLEEFQWDIARDLEEIQPLMDRCSKNLGASRSLEKVENYLEKVLTELQRIIRENNGTS